MEPEGTALLVVPRRRRNGLLDPDELAGGALATTDTGTMADDIPGPGPGGCERGALGGTDALPRGACGELASFLFSSPSSPCTNTKAEISLSPSSKLFFFHYKHYCVLIFFEKINYLYQF